MKSRSKKRFSLKHHFKLIPDVLIIIFVAGFILGILEGALIICNCPKVVVAGDFCCIDNNSNGICDSQENKSSIVVHAKGQGDVVIVSGYSITETHNETDVSPGTTPTTIITTTTSTTTTTVEEINQTIDDGAKNATEHCNNVELYIFRAIYNDGEESNVEILMRNDGAFDLKKFRIKVDDEENGLALQKRFYKRLNASSVDEIRFEFGENDLVNADNDVVRVRIAPIINEEICEEYSIYGDKLETHN